MRISKFFGMDLCCETEGRGNGQRGFTLFTALVAFILIVLAMLLVQSMISTERSTSEIISGISEQQEMQAIADLARADALQVFNFGIRYTIEDFSTKDTEPKDGLPENLFVVSPDHIRSWDTLKQRFVADRFGVGEGSSGNQFALLAARHLISLLERADDARGYDIELDNPNEDTMSGILKDTFSEQSEDDPENFFEVINCNPDELADHFKDCTGTFYITMDLSEEAMSDERYEKFPQVKVENVLTKRVLKEPILPRGKFRIYVPIRLFKALAGAKEVGDTVFDPDFISGMPQTRAAAESYLENRVQAFVDAGRLGKEDDDFSVYTNRPFDVLVTTISTGPDSPPKISKFEVTLYFEEKNEKYRVSTLGNPVYGVKLLKTFT